MIRILSAGPRATVQDAGRGGHLREGVPPAGPADPSAFRAAQALVGNAENDAAIEVVGLPFTFTCDDARVIAATGREVAVETRDRLPGWAAIFARAGETVTVHGSERTRFAYLAVSGGVATPPVLGSRATYAAAGLGAPLRDGDALPLGAARARASSAGRSLPVPSYDGSVRAIAGPHEDRFAPEALARLFSEPFRVLARSDRQGTRLDGPAIAARDGAELLTCGVVAGAIQVPRGGAPIVLLADHQTTGGYPVVATVIDVDLGAVAQLGAGEALRFYRVERDEALELARVERRDLEAVRASD